jgi:mannosyltransferase
VPGAERARLNVLVVAWLVLPPAALLAVNAVVPMSTGHSLSLVTPAVAILLAAAVDAAAGWTVGRARAPRRPGPGAAVWTAPRGWLRPVASLLGVALVAAIAMPAYLAQRSPFAKDGGSDWAQVAAIVQRHATPGDDIVFDETTRPSRRPRLAMHVYPQQFADVVDVTLDMPYTNVAGLWDTTYGIRRVGSRIDDGDGRVWLVEYLGPDERGVVDSTGMHERLAALRDLGFTVADSYRLHRDVVYLVKRGTTS